MADLNLWSVPDYYGGLLGEEAVNKLQRQATGTAITNALIGYLAQPKTMGYGSALPYIGKALAGGYQAGQEVIAGGLRDYETKQKLEELARQKKARETFDVAAGKLYKNIPAQMETVTTPGGYAPAEMQPGQVAPNFSMTRLPDVTTQREIAPARQELDPQVLQQLMLSGDPRATQYLTGLKTLKDITKAEVGESPFDKPNIKDFTADSIAIYNRTRNPADLIPTAKPEPRGPTAQQEYEWAKDDPEKMKFLQNRWTATANAAAAANAPYRSAESIRQDIETQYKYGTPSPTAPAQVSVSAGGKTYYFPDQKSANAFKKKAGL